MNASLPPLIPDNAPFSPAQRAWLNGFFAGVLNLEQMAGVGRQAAAGAEAGVAGASPLVEEDDLPWHDPALELDQRLRLAADRPMERRLMAAMGQLDCGQCGYDCKSYAEAIASGAEAKLNLCQPGGKPTQRMLKKLLADAGPAAADAAEAPAPAAPLRPEPVVAHLKVAQRLNGADSEKDTRHVVIDLNGSRLTYQPGDSLGVFASNDPALADAIVARLGAEPSAEVGDGNGHSRALRQALLDDKDLRNPTSALFRLLADTSSRPEDAVKLSLLAEDEDPDGDVDELDMLDLLERFGSATPAAKAFCEALDDLQPRLYSISSSPRAHAGEVHLTVGVTREDRRGRRRNGVASTFLAERADAGQPIRVYRQPAHGFALPADPSRPVIMIGPGTGIAPFRAFLQERRATGASGRNWLFFGNPHSSTDFLYRDEIEDFRGSGLLTRLDLAFSRDQQQKVYVQHRILEAGEELWRWLDDGAHVYVCGDAKRMAADVDKALGEIAQRHGGADGKAYLRELASAGRYQRDVY